jgi:dCMP deaminase
MLIGISGSVCSGKHTTAEYLVQHHGFLRLHLPTPLQTQPSTTSTTSSSRQTSTSKPLPKSSDVADAEQNVTLARLAPSVSDQKGTRGLTFPDVDALLEFVTNRWREHWVLTDIYDEATLEVLLRRPFFLLLNVDAPVGVRYARFSERYDLLNIVFSFPFLLFGGTSLRSFCGCCWCEVARLASGWFSLAVDLEAFRTLLLPSMKRAKRGHPKKKLWV